jgi:cation diffusion facilitator family transporter
VSPVNQNQEKRVLQFSSILAAAFAIGGLLVGTLLGSIVIVFDGVYSLISLLLTLLSLVSAKYIHAPHDPNFPNGRAIIEPVVIAIKGMTILALVLYSMYSAIEALFTGGVVLNIGVVSAFAVVNVLGCAFAWWKIRQLSQAHQSGLMDAEAKQWKMDTVLSIAVGVGFLAAWAMTLTPLAGFAAYADPVLMLLISGYFLKVPFEMVTESGRELLQMSPRQELVAKVQESVDNVSNAENVELGGVVKVGHELRIDLNVTLNKNSMLDTKNIAEIKRSIVQTLSSLPLDVKLKMNMAVK